MYIMEEELDTRMAVGQLVDAMKRTSAMREYNSTHLIDKETGRVYDADGLDDNGEPYCGAPENLISMSENNISKLEQIIFECGLFEEMAAMVNSEKVCLGREMIGDKNIYSKYFYSNYISRLSKHGLEEFVQDNEEQFKKLYGSEMRILVWQMGAEYAKSGGDINKIPDEVLEDVAFIEGFIDGHDEALSIDSTPGLSEWVTHTFGKMNLEAEKARREIAKEEKRVSPVNLDEKGE